MKNRRTWITIGLWLAGVGVVALVFAILSRGQPNTPTSIQSESTPTTIVDTDKAPGPNDPADPDMSDPAYLLASIDTKHGKPTVREVDRHERVLQRLHRKCPTSLMNLADQATNVRQRLKSRVHRTITTAAILREVDQAIPSPNSKFTHGDERCLDLFALIALRLADGASAGS